MQSTAPFREVPTADFVNIILDGGEQADEAMYYLLRQRLYPQLRKRFEVFHNQLLDGFDDVRRQLSERQGIVSAHLSVWRSEHRQSRCR